MTREQPSVAPLRLLALGLGLFGIFPLAAVLKYAPVVAWLPAAARQWAITTPLVIGACLAFALVSGARADRFIERLRAVLLSMPGRDFAAWAALVTLLLSLIVGWYMTRWLPVAGDELTQRFQATLLLHGRVTAVAEPHPEFVGGVQTGVHDGRWFGQFPIGGPILLAMGMAISAPWLINPLLAAWTTHSLYRFASRTTDETTARAATLLFAFSPFVVIVSGTQENQAGALAFLMFALSMLPAWAESEDSPTVNRAAGWIGLSIAAAAAIRPYDAALIGFVVGVFQLHALRRGPIRARSLKWEFLAGLAVVALLLVANWRSTGNPLLFGYDAVNGARHRPGFHLDPIGNQFSLFQGLHHTSVYLIRMNVSLFIGPIPGLLFVLVPLVFARTATRWDLLAAAIIAAIAVGYAAYWAESFLFTTPRFLYSALPMFLLFAARAPAVLLERTRSLILRRAVPFILPVVVAVPWLIPTSGPQFVGVWRTFVAARGAAYEIGDIGAEAMREGLVDALVLVHESWHGRLTARLRAAGTPALTAESIVHNFDACAIQRALEIEETIPGPPSLTRMSRIVARAMAAGRPRPVQGLTYETEVSFVGGLIDEPCFPQLDADRQGATPLDFFLPYELFDAQGRLGGRVVFVRDFGVRNERLLERFGDRTWYRYRPRRGPEDQTPMFIPYRGLGDSY